jgi:general secretion pathway protein M
VSAPAELLERGVRWWASLQARERRLLGTGAAVVALALAYLIAFEPAYAGRQRLAKELPALRAQLAQMEGLAAEARRLSGQASQAVDSPQQLKAQLEQSVEAAGLKGSLAQLSVSGDLIDVRFKSVPLAAWLGWFDTALRETRLRAVDMAVDREAAPGVVSARLTLEAPKRGP